MSIAPRLVRRVLVMAAAALLSTAACAQGYPDRPVRLVVPWSAGGGADIAARVFGEKLAASLGQQVVIDNRPGATGNIGAELVAHGPADGYTLLFTNEALATNPVMFRGLRYDSLKDFVPIAKVASNAVVIAAHPSLPVRNFQELVALGRTTTLNYAVPGVGSGPHLLGALLAMQSGARFNAVPYKGSAPATADAVGGQVDFIISTLAPMVPHLASGRLRGLAVTGGKRSAQAPDIPTLGESGVRERPYDVWYGLAAPSGVPQPIVMRLQQASAQVVKDAELVKKLRDAGYEVEPTIGADFGADIRADMERWARVVREAKIQPEELGTR